MEISQILEIFDKEQRQEVEYTDSRREVTPDVVRHVTHQGHDGSVIYSWLTAANADRVIKEQVAYFEGIGHNFEWKVFDHDTPSDLKTRLVARGFEAEEPEAVMVLDLEAAPAALLEPVTLDIRQLIDPARLDDAMAVQREVWQEPFEELALRLTNDLRHNSDELAIYVAYVDNRPVSCAWIYFHPGSQFASLWGGSTLADYRRQGFYRALLAVRAQAAKRYGARFLTVDASSMSRPVLEKIGFQTMTWAHACNWYVDPAH